MLSELQLAILGAIRPGRDALGTGTEAEELRAQFPDAVDALRRLIRDGYVEVVTISLDETGPPSPDVHVYHLTDRGENAVPRSSSD